MQEQTRRRVGLMGGTFDPIHIGHRCWQNVLMSSFSLSRYCFFPAGNPPHKDKRKVGATDAQRIDMVRLAIEGNPHFKLDPEEMLREGYTYTKDTLNLLTQKHPDIDYYFIIGADSLMAFDTWYHPEEICRDSILAVAVRDQMGLEKIQAKMHRTGRTVSGQNLPSADAGYRHRIQSSAADAQSETFHPVLCNRSRMAVHRRASTVSVNLRKKDEYLQSDKNAEKAEKIY
ncbi:MAG: nicotinate (nicotinamide) nucleotide adenylyltransferase [Lachnospiraceae bacterium]